MLVGLLKFPPALAGAVNFLAAFVPSAFIYIAEGDNIPSSVAWVMMLMGAASAAGVLTGYALA